LNSVPIIDQLNLRIHVKYILMVTEKKKENSISRGTWRLKIR